VSADREALGTFPFGQPLRASVPSAHDPRPCFLLGAYPSAFHIQWVPPEGGGRAVRALAVDNEPEPFWTGRDEQERLGVWLTQVGWGPKLGEALPAGDLNGSSGVKVEQEILRPLGLDRKDTLLTDCLDTYHLSEGMSKAIGEVYEPLARRLDLPSVDLPKHPGEREIVQQAQKDRLAVELQQAEPEVVITLGRAALEVLNGLVEAEAPARLAAEVTYGAPIDIRVSGRPAKWYPLVHPGQQAERWRTVHGEWMDRLGILDR